MHGSVVGIFVCPVAGEPMQARETVEAFVGQGLDGDRYSLGKGSFNKGALGKRQVTLINAQFFKGSGFEYVESRRNIVTEGVELMWLIGRKFAIGDAVFEGVKYCDPCDRPTKLAHKKHHRFREDFFDRGGLVASVAIGGVIKVGDFVVPPPKNY